MLDWDQHLRKLWAQHTLGHFYILADPSWPTKMELAQLGQRAPFPFMASVLNVDPAHLIDHPDFLFLRPLKERYTLTDLENAGLFSFLELASFAQGHRFIVFAQAERLSEIILNKLLKTLENPPPQTTIFFLGQKENFPATILSRAALWRKSADLNVLAQNDLALGPELRQALQDFWAHQRSWSFIQEMLHHHPEREAALLKWIFPKIGLIEDYKALQQLQLDWQAAEKAQELHRPKVASFYILLTGLRQHLTSTQAKLN